MPPAAMWRLDRPGLRPEMAGCGCTLGAGWSRDREIALNSTNMSLATIGSSAKPAATDRHWTSCVTRTRPGSMTTKRLYKLSVRSASSFKTSSASVERAFEG